MAVDNPSYFSLRGGGGGGDASPGASSAAAASADACTTPSPATSTTTPTTTPRGFGGLFRRANKSWSAREPRVNAGAGAGGGCDGSKCITPLSATGGQRRSLRNLFRSASASADCERTRQFLKGEPRPSDVAPPSPYLGGRSHARPEQGGSARRLGRRRSGAPRSSGDLLNVDMVFCGLAGESLAAGAAAAVAVAAAPTPGLGRSKENEYYRFEQRGSLRASEAATLPIDEPEDEPRSYYNLAATLPKLRGPAYSSMDRQRHRHLSNNWQKHRRRRHSIGTFLEGERCELGHHRAIQRPTTDLVVEPTNDDSLDRAEMASRLAVRPDRSGGTRHAQPAAFQTEAGCSLRGDDVVFISNRDNEASALWVNYLTACFEQISRQQGRPPFRVAQIAFEEQLSQAADLKIRESRLQIVVVCPIFLEHVTERPGHAIALSRLLGRERVLAMMLGVLECHLSAAHRASLLGYPAWRKFFVKDQDETFVGQFLGAAVAILGSAVVDEPGANALKVDRIGFSVHPKKVKMGHNRILALLNEPLQPEDSVCVTVDRCGEAVEVGHVKRRNPYVLQFSVPERCLDVSMLVGVRIARNGAPLGVRQVKCESRLRELDQILRAHDNPLEFMCQTFGFNPGDREQLDNWMVHAFQKNIPPHFNLLSNPPGDLQLSKNHSSSEENPTLLHFAARFGLEKLAWQLLECPGGDVACDLRNTNDHTPADLAEQAGHARLAHQLRGYMQMNEFSNMYSYLKVMSENTNGSANGHRPPPSERLRPTVEEEPPSSSSSSPSATSRQEDYCRPRPLSEAYSVPPAARPVPAHFLRALPDYSTPPPQQQQQQQQQTQPTATPAPIVERNEGTAVAAPLAAHVGSGSSLELPLQGYVQMDQASGLRLTDSPVTSPTALTSSPQPTAVAPRTPSAESRSFSVGGSIEQLSTKSSLSRSSQSSSSGKSRECPQDELLEIITDFKNNVFTISEVERLVENWRNRNDVQQSFKDKQRQLSAMRDEYERIQKRIKDEMKAPTPFDRIKKFFTKGKKDSKDSAGSNDEATPSKPNGAIGNLADRRPVSSLSLHSVSSSSSSGRMSTMSGCSGSSLGDSGTHSDTEERRPYDNYMLRSVARSSSTHRTNQARTPWWGERTALTRELSQLQHPAPEEKAPGITSYEIPPAPKPFHGRLLHHHHNRHHHQQQQQHGSRYTPSPGRGLTLGPASSAAGSELDLRPVKSSHPIADDKEYYIAFPPSGLPVHSFKSNGSIASSREPTTPSTPLDFGPSALDNKSSNYANVTQILNQPPGMCIPFEYVNIAPSTLHEYQDTATNPNGSEKLLKVQPEIHPEPVQSKGTTTSSISDKVHDENNDQDNDEENESEATIQDSSNSKNVEVKVALDYASIQVAASEEIARNFGVTLKKLPGPPTPSRSEFNFATALPQVEATAGNPDD